MGWHKELGRSEQGCGWQARRASGLPVNACACTAWDMGTAGNQKIPRVCGVLIQTSVLHVFIPVFCDAGNRHDPATIVLGVLCL
jgi:hypothetical protein